jgi:hypothetical protein
MSSRKQRINVMVSSEMLEALEESVPEYQRSEYIESAVRERLGLPPMENQGQKGFAAYERNIDYGAGRQIVLAQDGTIVSQSLSAKPGLYHSYTGDGNPEWIGQNVSVLRGNGFKRIRGQRLQDMEMDWLQSEVEA